MALDLNKASLFRLSNCTVGRLHSNSLTASSVTSVQLVDSVFEVVDVGAFNLQNVHHLEVTRCQFRQLNQDTIRAKNVTFFAFGENRVEHLGPNALSLAGLQNGSVALNWFKAADPDSLPSTPEFRFFNNSFFCDCALAWLWEDRKRNADVRSSASCWGPASLRKLSLRQLAPSPRGKDCKELAKVPQGTVPVQGSPDSKSATPQDRVGKSRTAKPLTSQSSAGSSGGIVYTGFMIDVSQCASLLVILLCRLRGF